MVAGALCEAAKPGALARHRELGERGQVGQAGRAEQRERRAEPERVARVLVLVGPPLVASHLPLRDPADEPVAPRQLRQRAHQRERGEPRVDRAAVRLLPGAEAEAAVKVLCRQHVPRGRAHVDAAPLVVA